MPSMLQAKTESDVIALERDNWQIGDWGLLCDGYTVWISLQPMGSAPVCKIEVPKAVFDQMVEGYIAQQRKPKPKSAR